MINMNSPTVQAMLQNTPQGFGNMPAYYGDMPTVTQTSQHTSQIPFPSPKEMLINGGQNMIYNPTSFAPRNIVGAYNSGYQTAFDGYANPYMDYSNQYNPYTNPYMNPYSGYFSPQSSYFMTPPDEDSRERLEAAYNNGLTYDEQLRIESRLFKKLSRIVSHNIDRSEEDAKLCEEAFDIYDKYPREDPIPIRRHQPMSVVIMKGDETVIDSRKSINRNNQDYYTNKLYIESMKHRQAYFEVQKILRYNQLYSQAPERLIDNVDMFDVFNNADKGFGILRADSKANRIYEQSIRRTSQIYDRDSFRKRLLENNGLKSRDQMSAIERFAGRYGVMPDGRPVSPGHDPAIASSFSYDPKTGQYNVTAPNFIRDRLEMARESFIKSIDDN